MEILQIVLLSAAVAGTLNPESDCFRKQVDHGDDHGKFFITY